MSKHRRSRRNKKPDFNVFEERRTPRRSGMRKVVCCVVYDENDIAVRVLPNNGAAANWIEKHCHNDIGKFHRISCPSRASVNRVFDRQMQLGLTDTDVIADLLWYGGISTKWKPQNPSKE